MLGKGIRISIYISGRDIAKEIDLRINKPGRCTSFIYKKVR
jgi:hypothetical protein